MSGKQTLTPIYDCHCKKYETTRRRIFKDINGKYKEKLEIQTCEKRTLFGSPPFEANSNWKLEDLSDIDENESESSPSHGQKKRKGSSILDTTQSSDFDDTKTRVNEKSNSHFHVDAETFERHFKGALEDIISRLRSDNNNQNMSSADIQGVKKIFQKKRLNEPNSYSTASNTDPEFNKIWQEV